ncbi:luciferase family oxidoreductase, group 1 [Pasteurella testudinis DSM 23072]|uniref:Luciferase-like monooxygenase n=1 Tax=Pasteurella testudinis DSM 23072 TaxID=1122938 RepID=A0A1W1V196_9PAST|nr:LLM class flavin-dependent oxidoreductase [Pasteurella testudinis]SMB87072.1 luciferase family oxidoreductase, group 1 [Pasteurella testudinis DSM 23072]SUB51707.1 Limonene 1,2-monooxygenase [Pasteurella testudinis]
MNNTGLPVSVLNLAPVRAGFDNRQAIEAMTWLAQQTEQLGYSRYWVAEHHNTPGLVSSATSILISHLLQHTQQIRVGSGGVMLPNHSPLMVAEQYGTLETLYPNRIDLGLGRAPGTDQATAQALRRNPVMESALSFPDDVRTLQRYLGDADKQGFVKAYPGIGTHIPLYILGSSTESAYLAAELGLPYVFAAHFAPRMLESAVAIYRQQFKPSSVLAEPYFILCLNVIAAETDEEADFLATSQQRFFLNVVRNTRLPLQPPKAIAAGEIEPHEQQVLDSMTACTLLGSQATVAEQLDELQRIIKADEIMAVTYIYDQEKQLNSYRLFKQIAEQC